MPEVVKGLKTTTLRGFRVTSHALKAAASDRYGKLDIPAAVTFRGSDVVEAEVNSGKVTKLVVRVSYDATRDAIYVFGLENGVFLKTVWFNLKTDRHATLRRELYAKA